MDSNLAALEGFHTDGYANNGVPRNPQYEIPDIVLGAPTTRKIRIISVGTGISGIMNAYYIQKELENVEHVMYEKNADIGGTWLENTYPGCGCDVPSHAYTFPFALNPDWPRYFSYAPDIWKYLNKVCEVWSLRKYMHFNHEVIGCWWQQETGEWLVKIKETGTDGSSRVFEDRCHFLLHGTGILNNWKWPEIPGINFFAGKLIHTARWPKGYQAAHWKGERVAVIGSGSSSIQVVPSMQPLVKHMDVFVRSPIWFMGVANNHGTNVEYTDAQKTEFRSDANKLVEHAKGLEDQINGTWGGFYTGAAAQAANRKYLKERMAEHIKDEWLLEGFTPDFGVGCRRVSPGDPYMRAVQQLNVDVHFTGVERITAGGLIGEDGEEHEVDTIVCATGFDVSYRPRFPIVGLDGVDLADKWKVCPEGYMGLAIPGFPNFLTFIGPAWPIFNGSIMGPLGHVSQYAMQMIRKVQSEYICGISPKQEVADAFNEHVQEWVRHTVWTEDCRSWYKDTETGRVNAVWPGSSLHYNEAIRTPRYEDFDITYLGPAKQNRFAWLGMGFTRTMVEKGDSSPYLSTDKLDPKWLEALKIGEEGKEKKEVLNTDAEQSNGLPQTQPNGAVAA